MSDFEEKRPLEPAEATPMPVEPVEPAVNAVPPQAVPVEPAVSAVLPQAVPVEPAVNAVPPQAVPVEPAVNAVPPQAVSVEPAVSAVPPQAVPVEPAVSAVPPQAVPVEPAAVPENGCTYHRTGAAGSYGSEPQPVQPGPAVGYDQAAYSYGYAAPGGSGPAPAPAPKKKMKRGARVFLGVLLACVVLSLGALVGMGVYTYMNSGGDGTAESPLSSAPSTGGLPGTPTTPPGNTSSQSSSTPENIDLTPNDGIVIGPRPAGEPLSPQEVYDRVVDSTVVVTVTYTDSNGNKGESIGSGVIVTEDGYIITNSHVVQDTRNVDVVVTTHSEEEYNAVVVGYDRTTDLAVIKVNARGLKPAAFGSTAEMSIGEQVITIGNPGGADFAFSMTGGYISGLNRHVGSYSSAGMTYIQTDAAINPGNSGGALVNMYGQVIGINSSKIVADEYESMGFAIPIDKAQTIISDLMSGGFVTGRVRLGISGMNVTDAQVYAYGVPYGFIIVEVDDDSSFAGTGVQAGDIITAVDGEEVSNLTQLSNKLLEYSPGDTVTVTLYRLTTALVSGEQSGSYFNVEIVLLADLGETQR